ncbi:SixA phosphatase family protein [Marinitenerispora sediminis]|uniref:Histidine phosphatase family protein n=1 Tax=Marinitenerispora sediminis TaxID=1931232 RepID=A0A368TBK3_9ACTN|nr:histidine phosphatase family protein [Marinitenerispora sediminis]RCV53652.1 histidine phosphatase family protein [Marinitenerispora sediminis]RCV57364.1 histidine phosphatase family protein [Marinitenerispora sediminis]RCV62356.1 histidine phosphatase family protein [Marinitenerispora sediminis]
MSGRLVILRHADAEHIGTTADMDRELTDEGRARAAAAGELLTREGVLPDHVICSPARRTRQTLDLVAARLPTRPTVEYEPAAYTADPDEMLELISRVDTGVRTLLVVGHNPTMAQLALAFTDSAAAVSFPPASIAVVDLEVGWLYAAPGTGTGRILPRPPID